MNLRLAYGKTLARPTFREIALVPVFDFMGGRHIDRATPIWR